MLVLLLHFPAVKSFIGTEVANALESKLGTEVKVGSVDLGMLNRIIIDDVLIMDQDNHEMLRAPRLSAKARISDLFNGKITVSSIQVFGMKADFYRKTANSNPNFQFVIDSLASKDTTKHTPLNLEISSLIIRHGEVTYNQLDIPNDMRFSTKHINVKDVSAHLILNKLTDDSLDLNVKKISLKATNGLEMKNLSLRLIASNTDATFSDVLLEFPNSSINIPKFSVTYKKSNKELSKESIAFNGRIIKSSITPCDLKYFTRLLDNYKSMIFLSADIDGNANNISFKNINISQGKDLVMAASGKLCNIGNGNDWNIDIKKLNTSSEGISSIAENLGKGNSVPTIVKNIGNISLSGYLAKSGIMEKASIKLSTDNGYSDIIINKVSSRVTADVDANRINLQKLTSNKDLGLLNGKVSVLGVLSGSKIMSVKGNAKVNDFTYKNHTYDNVDASIDYVAGKDIHTCIDIADDGGTVNLKGNYDLATRTPKGNIEGKIKGLDPAALGLTKKWEGSTFDFAINGDFIGNDINSALGNIKITDLTKHTGADEYHISSINIRKVADGHMHKLTMKSDFGSFMAEGNFNYKTLANSITNAIYDRLPTIPGIKRKPQTNNKFNVYGTVNNSDWAKNLLGVDLQLYEPAHIVANVDDSKHKVDLTLDALMFVYNGKEYHDGYIRMSCPNDTMKAIINAKSYNNFGFDKYTVRALAIDNHLTTKLQFQSEGKQIMSGEINADANFYENSNGLATADIKVLPSTIYINDSIWNINPAKIKYYANYLEVNDFSIHHEDQYIAINGKATKNPSDNIEVDLKDVDVSYILNLVNFHSVDFAGYATGKATAKSLFSAPQAEAKLNVKNFTFESGQLGTLDVAANWNLADGAINVNGIAIDKEARKTDIRGYISPKHNDINLNVKAYGTNLAFLQKYCDTFMNDINVYGWGELNVVGPLKKIELVGKARVEGSACVTSLNTYYYLHGDSVWLRPDDIVISSDSIYDRDGHLGIVNGHLRHQHLGHWTYDLNIDAQNLLAYDTHDFGDFTFYGTAFCTGKCDIRGKSGEVVIDVDATPEKGSQLVYNVASPDELTNQEFISFHNRNNIITVNDDKKNENKSFEKDMSANVYLNFLIHANTDATIKLLMDQNSGDYIQLNGDGVIRASYYNKGSFDMFGNYTVNNGIYKLTIQNVIKRDFEFLQGGTIAFGGDAYNAALNLQAQYTINGVSLSDINLGKSFSNNNIRVNCLMDITGTPNQPKVDFSLDMPTVSTDAKQMIMSLMNSEEEMKQQVVYLLAVGRFFNQGTNNSYTDGATQSQASLAMQSILSGTISQELSSILSNVVKNNDWNFGANISTGDEGLYNAEYEGLVSGRLLNNRLLINGQFGYRNNQNTNSTFIGDFDVRYLLVPSGSLAIKIYNQTNDKYFTKNSLNTQGVGLILKKDFNGWREFFHFKKSKGKSF